MTWRSAIALGCLAVFAPVLASINEPEAGWPLALSRGVSIAWALGLLGFLIPQRKHPSLAAGRIVFALIPIPALPTFWLLAHDRAAHGHPLEIHFREALTSIIVAVVTPPRAAISIALIAAFSVESFILFWEGQTSHWWSWQPWTNFLYACCTMGIALYQAHRQRREVAMIVELEQAAALQRLTRAYLAVRDVVNTPLQILQVSLSLLSTRNPEASDLTRTMQRSVERLNELNHLLAAEASAMDSQPGAESFDPTIVLRTRSQKEGSNDAKTGSPAR
jgi:hypothetical protein